MKLHKLIFICYLASSFLSGCSINHAVKLMLGKDLIPKKAAATQKYKAKNKETENSELTKTLRKHVNK
jgi:hypothetical protein